MKRMFLIAFALLVSAVVPMAGNAAVPVKMPQIIGGSNAAPGAFPYAAWVVAQYVQGSTQITLSCTGSLVAPTVVLTAGHCAFDDTTRTALLPATSASRSA